MISGIVFVAVGILLFAVIMRLRSAEARREQSSTGTPRPMMPRAMSGLIGLLVSLPVLAVVIFLEYLLLRGVSDIVLLIVLLPTSLVIPLFVSRTIRERFRWTPNPDRDRNMNDWSMLIFMSILVVCESISGVLTIRDHETPYLAILVVLITLYGMGLRVREMRRR